MELDTCLFSNEELSFSRNNEKVHLIVLGKSSKGNQMQAFFSRFMENLAVLENSAPLIYVESLDKTDKAKGVVRDLVGEEEVEDVEETKEGKSLVQSNSERNRLTHFSKEELEEYQLFKKDISDRVNDPKKFQFIKDNDFARFFCGYSYDRQMGKENFISALVFRHS